MNSLLFSTINTDILRENLKNLRAQAETPIIAVIKHDAYSHGAVECARALSGKAAALAVSTLHEARALLDEGISDDIMVLDPICAGELCKNSCGVILPVDSPEILSVLANIYMSNPLRVQLRLDLTGNGIGMHCARLTEALDLLDEHPDLHLYGVFAHVSSLYRSGDVREVAARFREVGQAVRQRRPGALLHIATSASYRYKALRFDACRIGTALYGLPSREGQHLDPLRPVLSLSAPITRILSGRESLSFYDRCVSAALIDRAGLVAAGYGQLPALGYARGLRVLVRGRSVPVVGSPCMGHLLVDLTGVPDAHAGDEAVFVGQSGDRAQTAEDLAKKCGVPSCRCDGVLFTGTGTRRIYTAMGNCIVS